MNPSDFYTRYQPVADFLIASVTSRAPRETLDASTAQRAIQNLVKTEDFRLLADRMMQPNPFAVMGRLTDEVRHSNLLAYLLTPCQTHGYDAEVLFSLCPTFRGTQTTPPSDPRHVIVLREHVGDEFRIESEEAATPKGRPGRPDLVVYDPVMRRLAIIELKIGSAEGVNQRRRYRQWATEFFSDYHLDGPGWECNFIYLAKGAAESTTVFNGVLGAKSVEIPVGGEFQAGDDENSVWTMANYGHVTKVLSAAVSRRPAAAGRQLVDQYLAFLGEHVCRSEGIFAQAVDRLVSGHPVALAATNQERTALRQDVIAALQPDFLELGLQIDNIENGRFVGNPFNSVQLSYARDSAGNPLGWEPDADELNWKFSVFVENIGTALCAELKVDDVIRRKHWADRFAYQAKRENGAKRRALTVKLPMPIQQKPYPLTRANAAFLVEHLRMRLRTKAKFHIDHARH